MIRLAQDADVAAITTIYNEAIATTTATFDIHPKSVDNRREWLRARDAHHPVTVFTHEEHVVGWGALNPWSDKAAYGRTAEDSIYVQENNHGCGIGKALLTDLVTRARAHQLHTLVARIADDNKVSLKLHAQLGFKEVGILKQVGHKFGRHIDVHMYQLML